MFVACNAVVFDPFILTTPCHFLAVALTMNMNQMAVENPYGVKAVSDEDAALMRAYTPACVALIEGCQDTPEVSARPGPPRLSGFVPQDY